MPSHRYRNLRRVACAAPLALLVAAPAASAALTPVPQRSAFEVNRIDSPEAAALPDGRVLVGWTNGTNNGDTTLAMVRPAGGLLPSKPQVLRTGYSGEDVSFLTGGPANDPVISYWQDGDSRTPFRVKLDGELFTTQTAIFSGTYGYGRFPRYVRCPDGSTYFAYQYTSISPPAPASYSSSAFPAKADGAFVGGSYGSGSSPDYYQDPTITCDRGTPLFATAIDGDDHQGADLPERLRVLQLGAGGGSVLDRTLSTGNAYAQAPDARIAPDGRVWLVWSETESGPGGLTRTYVATRAPGVSGAATVNPTPLYASGDTYPNDLFFDAAGNTHLLIEHESAGGTSYGIRTAPLGAAEFGAEQPVLATGNHSVRLIQTHPDGNPRLLVTTYGPAPDYRSSYELRGIPQAGSGNAVTPLDFDGGFASTTFLPTGDLFIVGVHEVAANQVQMVEGGLDTGAPPTLDGVDVPGLAAASEPTTIAISAKDPMGLSTFAWTVSGDGLASPITLTDQRATIPGLNPGSYTVRARAVDRAGNAAEITRTLRVLDPAAVTPGSAAFADAVSKAGGTLDRTAPSLTNAEAKRGRKGAAKRKVTVALRVNEPAAADLELIGTLKRGGQQGTLVLKSARIASLSAGKGASQRLTIPASLAKLVGNRLRVRITATDAAGNRVQRTVNVTTAKK